MRTVTPISTLAFVALTGAICLAGCGGTSQVDVGATSNEPLPQTTSTGGTQQTTTSRYLEVTVNEVAIHVAGGDTSSDKGSAADKGAAQQTDASSDWTTVVSDPHRLNLLDAQSAEKLIGSGEAPAGKVTEIRLILANDAQLVTSTGAVSVTCPSCTQTGLKIPTEGTVDTSSGGTLHLTLDFDQLHSLTQDASGDWRLDPVVHIARASQE
jgi:hypothetical protein